MTGAEWVAVFAGATTLVTAATAGVVNVIMMLNQNKKLAQAEVKRDECAVKLDEVHTAVSAVTSVKPPPLPDQPFTDALKAEEKDHAHQK